MKNVLVRSPRGKDMVVSIESYPEGICGDREDVCESISASVSIKDMQRKHINICIKR